MRLELDRLDLLPEFSDLPCSQIKHEHFNRSAYNSIVAVLNCDGGRATFWEYDRRNYNAIFKQKLVYHYENID